MTTNITAVAVLWNEAHRIGPLVARLREGTDRVVLGVQDSADGTLTLARGLADRVVEDRHHGYGDATMPQVVKLVKTPWAFRVDGDELPTEALMESLSRAAVAAEALREDGVWIRFRSWIDDIEWEPYHAHLRLFRASLGWPGTLHSRPHSDSEFHWKVGWIEHRKSLDEHVRGYLEYLRVGAENRSWTEHNTAMLWHACVGTAKEKGWKYVESFDWWPQVEAAAFAGGVPALPEL